MTRKTKLLTVDSKQRCHSGRHIGRWITGAHNTRQWTIYQDFLSSFHSYCLLLDLLLLRRKLIIPLLSNEVSCETKKCMKKSSIWMKINKPEKSLYRWKVSDTKVWFPTFRKSAASDLLVRKSICIFNCGHIKTIVSISCENMHGYLSADMICS